MASKEVKLLLKAAKESIEKKDYEGGAIQCKNALVIDKSNYMALVLLGACQQEIAGAAGDARRAFKQATALSPDLALAWKGLAQFYEKLNRPTDREELLVAYMNLFRLEEDPEKAEEWSRKIGVLLSLLDLDAILEYSKQFEMLPANKFKMGMKTLLGVFGQLEGDITEECLSIVVQILNEDWGSSGILYLINVYKKYLKLLFKMKELPMLLKRAREMCEKFPTILAGPEWYCKAYLEVKFATTVYEDELPEIPTNMYLILLEQAPDSYLGYACKGVDELECQEYVAACESLSRSLHFKPTYAVSWYLLTQCQTWLYRFSDAEYSARQALQYWKQTDRNIKQINNCKYWLAKALCEQNSLIKVKECIRIADEFIYDDPNKNDFLIILIKASIKVDNKIQYEKFLDLLTATKESRATISLLRALWAKKQNDSESYANFLSEASSSENIDHEILLEMGVHAFESKLLKKALKYILKSTTLNEWCPANYRYLGHVYKELGDLSKARRCYQRAFQICPSDFESGIELSDVFRLLGLEEENMKLLTVAKDIPGARWAWLKLGIHYLTVNNPVEAVNSLRVAVRLHSEDRDSWESLGDAYLALGSYTAAQKSYEKVLELDPEAVYPLLQVATCKHLQGEDEQAVVEFRRVLTVHPDFVPGLKSHAQSCLALARSRLALNLLGLAADSCQEAVTSLCKALRLRNDLICLWKLLGDSCVLISKLPPRYCRLSCPEWILPERMSAEDSLDKSAILHLGVSSYCHVIALKPEIADYWFDLAFCYHVLADSLSSKDEEKTARRSSLAAVKKSLSIDLLYWRSWNLLGLIYVLPDTANYPLAQHSFVRAIELNPMNPVPWSNLGTLYTILGDLQLANQCFTESQRCNPDYVQCWVGQAILAERTKHHESMDLYRHSTQLGFHLEGALGYCSMVLRKILTEANRNNEDYIFSIKNMNAIVTATDVATWMTDWNPDETHGWCMLGLLLEQSGLLRKSAESFRQALELLASEDEMKDGIFTNYGRILLKLERTEEAMEILKLVETPNFESEVLLAKAQTNAKSLEDAYNSYQNVLERLASSDDERCQALVEMAAVVYQHQGHQDCKILLMQACQLNTAPTTALFACCALGLLHSDMSLAELAVQELSAYENDVKIRANVILFRAYLTLISGDSNDASQLLNDATLAYPDDDVLWMQFANLNLQLYCDGDSFRDNLPPPSKTSDKSLRHLSINCLISQDLNGSRQLAKRAIHQCPESIENWLLLINAVLQCFKEERNTKDLLWLKKTITRFKNQTDVLRFKEWLVGCEEQVNILVDAVLSV